MNGGRLLTLYDQAEAPTGRCQVPRRCGCKGSHLAFSIAGFSNLFPITASGSASVLTNMMVSNEQHVAWMGYCLLHLQREKLASIEATSEAEDDWVDPSTQSRGRTLMTFPQQERAATAR